MIENAPQYSTLFKNQQHPHSSYTSPTGPSTLVPSTQQTELESSHTIEHEDTHIKHAKIYRPHSSLAIRRKMWVWQKMSSDGDEFLEIGEVLKGDVAYSAKMGLSGRLKFKTGKYKENGMLIGEAKDQNLLSSACIISLPGGISTKIRKADSSSWSISIPVNGQVQLFVWQPIAKTLKQKLKGETGWHLLRQGDEGSESPLAAFMDDGGSGLRSKTKMGTFEFLGAGARGELGDAWAVIARISILKMKQKQVQREMVEAIADAA